MGQGMLSMVVLWKWREVDDEITVPLKGELKMHYEVRKGDFVSMIQDVR